MASPKLISSSGVDPRVQIIDDMLTWTEGDVTIATKLVGELWNYWLVKEGSAITRIITSKRSPCETDTHSRDPKLRRGLRRRPDVDADAVLNSLDDFGIYLMDNMEQLASYIESLTPKKTESQTESISDEMNKAAMELLHDPRLIEILDAAIKEKLVGETTNAFLTFFVILSAKMEEPLNHRWNGDSSTGKTAIVVSVVVLFPPEMIIMRGGMTPKVFYYEHGEEDESGVRVNIMTGKALILLEEEESQDFLREIKPILSHDMHEIVYSFVDKVDNKNQTQQAIIRGYPSYIGLTTQVVRDEQISTRATMGTPEYKPEKFEAIIDRVASDAVAPWARTKDAARLDMIRHAIRILKSVKVVVPYMGVVREHYQHHAPRAVRDFKQYRAIIETVAYLHQYQREHVTINGVEYVVANIFDLRVAARVTESILCETASGLPKDVMVFYQRLIADGLTANGDKVYTKSSLLTRYREIFGKDIGRTRLTERYVDPLVEKGLLDKDTSKKTHEFRVNETDLSLSVVTDKMIEEICSKQTKARIRRDYVSRCQTPMGGCGYVSEDVVDTLIYSALGGQQRDISDKVLERCFADEYPREYSSNRSTDNDRFSDEGETPESVDSTDESAGIKIMGRVGDLTKQYGRDDDHAFNVIAAKIEEEGFDTDRVLYCIKKYREGHRMYIPQAEGI